MYFMFFCNIPQSVICLISSGCINVMNDEPKRQQIIPGKYFLYSHNILQIRYHVFPFSLISNCHPHYSLSKILTNKLIYILYIVSYSYSIFCIQFIHIIFTHNIHIYIWCLTTFKYFFLLIQKNNIRFISYIYCIKDFSADLLRNNRSD